MPNTGMLDHRAYGSSGRWRSRVHWMEPWPQGAGYSTVHSSGVASFSRHLLLGNLHHHQSMAGRHGSRPSSSSLPHPSNSISPFHTTMKPTCGYFFSRETDNRKRRIGIPPSNLVAWRSKVGHTHQQRAQTAR